MIDIPIISVQQHGLDKLFGQLRKVPLMNEYRDVLPYKDATFEVRPIKPREINIAQRYVLSGQLGVMQALNESLQKWGFDLRKLNGFLSLKFAPGYQYDTVDLLPPIVERSKADETGPGNIFRLLNDGMHRYHYTMNAQTGDGAINSVVVDNVLDGYPYYAHPSAVGWNGVEVIDRLTPEFKKKDYREKEPGHRKFYRDFNIPFDKPTGIRQPGA